ncbi:hypothetical protein HYV82_05165 [Candidatus Woesearchaeota archaeon]|nr:hypothetical protein [Candidatus Woesearchaeota archaeon]
MVVLKTELPSAFGNVVSRAAELIAKRKAYVFIAALVIALLYIFRSGFAAVLTISVLFALSAVSTLYKRYFRVPPAFELMTFSVVVVTAKYGFLAGFIFGLIAQLTSEALHGAIDAQIIIFVPARALLALATWMGINLFGITDLFKLGIIAIIAYNLMVQPVSWFIGDVQLKTKTIFYSIFYTVFNLVIFSTLSKPAAFLLGL